MRLDSFWFSEVRGPVRSLLSSFFCGQQVSTESGTILRVLKNKETLEEVLLIIDRQALNAAGIDIVERELATKIEHVFTMGESHAVGSCFSLASCQRFEGNDGFHLRQS